MLSQTLSPATPEITHHYIAMCISTINKYCIVRYSAVQYGMVLCCAVLYCFGVFLYQISKWGPLTYNIDKRGEVGRGGGGDFETNKKMHVCKVL